MNRESCGDQAMVDTTDHLPHRPQHKQERKEKEGRSGELTLGPVGPLRHMGVVVVRHSTQHILPPSVAAGATPIT